MSLRERLSKEFIRTLPKAQVPLKWKLYTLVKWAKLAIRLSTALVADRHVACSNFLAQSHAFPWSVATLYNPIKTKLTQGNKNIAELSDPYCFVFPEETIERGAKVCQYVSNKFSPNKAASELIEICQELKKA